MAKSGLLAACAGTLFVLMACSGGITPRRAYAPDHPEAEAYAEVSESPFHTVSSAPLSTFSVDVDTASYSNVRRFLHDHRLPPNAAVRVEELINYFDYELGGPTDGAPVGVGAEVGACPWQPKHQLLMVGLRAKEIETEAMPPQNLVFLLDVSGSMQPRDKLPLLKRAMAGLTKKLRPQDSIGIVTYSDASRVVLTPTRGEDTRSVLKAIDGLAAGGGTNGSDGIQTAYRLARKHFKAEGSNRVILATDGDFNVGVTSLDALQELIEKEREGGVFLTVVGVGTGNLKDATMERLADKGNGHYVYLDSAVETRKSFDRELSSNLITVAKDVKIQVEFNPANVHSYRLIGYDNRLLADRDFNDDEEDAGDMGAGHSVVALYEVVPRSGAGVDRLRYQPDRPKQGSRPGELCQIKVRYKLPQADRSQRITRIVEAGSSMPAKQSTDFTFASAVAAFGLVLRDSEYKGKARHDLARRLAKAGLGADPHGDRHELLRLIDIAEDLAPASVTSSGK